MHVIVEKLETGPAASLGLIQRRVGIAEQVPRGFPAVDPMAIPMLTAVKTSWPPTLNWARALDLNLVCDLGRLRDIIQVLDQNGELVSAQPRDCIPGAPALFQPVRDSDEKVVADGMP